MALVSEQAEQVGMDLVEHGRSLSVLVLVLVLVVVVMVMVRCWRWGRGRAGSLTSVRTVRASDQVGQRPRVVRVRCAVRQLPAPSANRVDPASMQAPLLGRFVMLIMGSSFRFVVG